MRRGFRDEGGLVGRAAIVILLLVVVGGVLTIDAVSIVFTTFDSQNSADAAAVTGAASYKRTRDVSRAVTDAFQEVLSDSPESVLCEGQRFRRCNTKIEVDRSDGSVTVTVRRIAASIVMKRVGFLEDFTVVRKAATAEAPL